jgi:pilO
MMSKGFDINRLHLQNKPTQILFALVLIVVLLVLGYLVVFKDQWEEYQTASAKEVELRQEYETKALKAANLDNLKIELEELEKAIAVLLKQLPTNAEVPNLIQELHQAASKNGLVMDKVTPQAPDTDGPIQRLPFSISVTGSYDQIAQFARDVGHVSRIVTLSNITLSSNDEKNKGKLSFYALANTYKALDVSETASDVASGVAASSVQ